MVFLDLQRLLALTFFTDTALNSAVKSGQRTDLPNFSLSGISSITAQPILPSLFKAAAPLLKVPDWLPVFPDITLPAPLTAWVGDNKARPTDPTKDSFYNPDLSKYQNLKNGDIIAIRPVSKPAFSVLVDRVYQISYRTESTYGEPRAGVTTVLVPKINGNDAILSFQWWEDAAALKCSPSYQLIRGIYDPTIELFLSKGWVVNFPDHEGIKSAFVAGTNSGKGTLDSIKALVKAKQQLGISNEKIGLYGYSGGSQATGHAIELGPTYAPDLKITTAALGGYVANITDVVDTINGGLFAGFALSGVAGLSAEYPEFAQFLAPHIKPGSAWRYHLNDDSCLVWDLLNYIGNDAFSYFDFTSPFQLYNSDIWKKISNQEQLGKVAPKFPLYVHQGIQDQICRVQNTDQAVDNYCKGGTPVIYQRNIKNEHVSEQILGIVPAIDFLEKTFGGYVPSGCGSWQDATRQSPIRSVPELGDADFRKLVFGDYSPVGLGNYALV